MKTLIICTQDFSGLGWALLAKQQGGYNVLIAYKIPEDEEKKEEYNLVGNGLVEKLPIEKAMKECVGKGYYWIFDSNKLSEFSEKLRKAGEKVFGASSLTSKMEYDRAFAVKVAQSAKLPVPPSQEFSDVSQALEFLDQNEDKSYVFKPDGSDQSHLTFVPNREGNEESNRELYSYISNLKEGVDKFILQERIKGVETNFEIWFYQGKPFFSFCGLENKRKLNKDAGENVGCAGDYVFTVPLESEAIKKTIGKMIPFYSAMRYTGFADVNIIVSEKENYFLEVCNRFGYNSHPNLFLTLAKDSFGDIMTDFMDGKVQGMENRFKYGFGSSISLYLDHPRKGIPIYIKPETEKFFYGYDLYKEKDTLLLAGYDHQIGIITNHDYTIEDAGEGCLNKVYLTEEVSFPDMSYRSDMFKPDYPTAPVKRYSALKSMKYF